MVKSTNVSRFDMIVDIFDLNQFRHFRQTEMTTDRVDQLFLFDGLTPATWFALRIQYRLHHRYPGVKSDITTKQDLIFKTKSNMVNDDTVSDEKIIYLDNIVSRPDQLDVSIKSAFDNEPRIKVVVVPELILCDRGVIKANAIQLNHSSVTVINFDLKKANLRQNLIHSNSKNVPYEYHHHACSTLCIYPYIKTIIEQKDELFRGMAWCGSLEQAQNQILSSNSGRSIKNFYHFLSKNNNINWSFLNFINLFILFFYFSTFS